MLYFCMLIIMYSIFNKILSIVAKQYLVWKISKLPVSIYSADNKPIKHSLDGSIDVHILDESVFCDVLVHGELGLGRAYVEGKWTTNDLEALMVLLFSIELLHSWNPFAFNMFKKQIIHDNSMFLDPVFMAYSAGVWKEGDDMVSSAKNKIDLVIDKLDIKASDNVLDIGCGWGMIANYVYEKTRCNLTGLSISDSQIDYAKQHASKNIVFVNRNYRDIIGKYDKIYSIEMLEHVGRQNYQEFFKTICEALKPGGKASMQISVSTQEGSEPYLQNQFILTDVFPGGHIPRISWVMEAVSKVPGLRLTGIEFIDGHHFEKTFKGWNKSLREHSAVLDKKLLRFYDYYFSSCVGLYNNNVLGTCVFVFEKDTT